MKKILSIMIVLAVITTAVFAADFNLNLGLGVDYSSGKLAEKEGITKSPFLCTDDGFGENTKFQYTGFDIQLGFNVELNNHLVIYDNLDFVFVGEGMKRKADNDVEFKFKDESKTENRLMIGEAVGVGYAFHFNAMRLILGGGFNLNYLTFKSKVAGDSTENQNNVSMGLNILLQGDYMFSEHFGAFLALKPTVNFYNSFKFYSGTTELKGDGTGLGFNGSAIVGATYKF